MAKHASTLFALPTSTALNHQNLESVEHAMSRSPSLARCIIVGLPALGILASLVTGLPPFAAFMAASFLLATALTCGKALVMFAGGVLRLLVAARLVIILVLGALLFGATGAAWMALVSTVLLWLAAERLLGRQPMQEMRKPIRDRR